MKTTINYFTVLVFVLFFSINSFAQKNDCYQKNTPKEPISSKEINHLKHMAEEEKLAGDVYKTLYEFWNIRVFSNISKSEDRHQYVVMQMIEKYEIPFVAKTKRGEFNNTDFEKLYISLVEEGKKSLIDAYRVGAKIEELDIFDLNNAIEKDIDTEDLKIVFNNIRSGSHNHLRAFTFHIKRLNYSYEPQYISSKEYNEIINK